MPRRGKRRPVNQRAMERSINAVADDGPVPYDGNAVDAPKYERLETVRNRRRWSPSIIDALLHGFFLQDAQNFCARNSKRIQPIERQLLELGLVENKGHTGRLVLEDQDASSHGILLEQPGWRAALISAAGGRPLSECFLGLDES